VLNCLSNEMYNIESYHVVQYTFTIHISEVWPSGYCGCGLHLQGTILDVVCSGDSNDCSQAVTDV